MTDKKGYEWWPRSRVTDNPQDTYVRVIRDIWWATNKYGDVLMWRAADGSVSPQCNRNAEIVRRLSSRVEGYTGLAYLPVALLPIRIEDYR